jgi:hypothetical protein
MSTSHPSDPRLLLPEWLRDGDLPPSLEVTETQDTVESIAPAQALPVDLPAAVPSVPFSDRLSLDTRLDPGLLVSATDLPKWLGGLELVPPSSVQQPTRTEAIAESRSVPKSIEAPEPYEETEPSQDRVIDVQVTGWMMVAGALGLLVLLATALKLYLS